VTIEPRSGHPDAAAHQDLIFQAWRCLLGEGRAIYVSGPITTGLRWVEAVEAGRGETDRAAVLAANREALIAAAARLRVETGRTVIEPASLSVRGWSQADYLELWTNLIERHVGEMRLLPDWPFSIGCVTEFVRASRHQVAIVTLEGAPVSRADGIGRLEVAEAALTTKVSACPALHPLLAAIKAAIGALRAP
jgi:hypothetical protein